MNLQSILKNNTDKLIMQTFSSHLKDTFKPGNYNINNLTIDISKFIHHHRCLHAHGNLYTSQCEIKLSTISCSSFSDLLRNIS